MHVNGIWRIDSTWRGTETETGRLTQGQLEIRHVNEEATLEVDNLAEAHLNLCHVTYKWTAQIWEILLCKNRQL